MSTKFKILRFLNYSYFAKIMTRKPKIGNLTKVTKLYPFPESKKCICYLRGFLVTWRHIKTEYTVACYINIGYHLRNYHQISMCIFFFRSTHRTIRMTRMWRPGEDSYHLLQFWNVTQRLTTAKELTSTVTTKNMQQVNSKLPFASLSKRVLVRSLSYGN